MLKRIMLFLLAACLPLAAPALAEGGERPQIILMACYQQVGWGVYADAAFLDEEGGIWHYENEMGNCWVKLKTWSTWGSWTNAGWRKSGA